MQADCLPAEPQGSPRQVVKNPPANAGDARDVSSPGLGNKDPLEEGMASYASILAWKIPRQRSLVGYSSWGHKESNTTEATARTHSRLTVRPHGLQPARLLCPPDFPGKNTRAGCQFLLQGTFTTQESNPHLLHKQVDSLLLRYQGSPWTQRHTHKKRQYKETWEEDGHLQAKGGGLGKPSLTALGRNQLCWNPDVRFLASRSKTNFCFLSLFFKFAVLCYISPSKLT